MLTPVYYFGPFKNVFGFADPAKMAPLEFQPRDVLAAVVRHSLSCDARKEAQSLLDGITPQRNPACKDARK